VRRLCEEGTDVGGARRQERLDGAREKSRVLMTQKESF